jgi:hypothetical protein
MALTFAGEGGSENIVGFIYNGSSWSEITTGGTLGWAIQGTSSIMHYVEAMAVASDGTIYIAGSEDSNVDGRRLVASWNGTDWVQLGGFFNTFSVMRSLLVGPDGSLYAGGYFTDNSGTTLANIARWNGLTWEDVGGGTNGGVTDIKIHNGNLFISGFFTSVGGAGGPGGTAASGVAMWNGTSWSALGPGITAYNDLSMAFASNGDLYVGGQFYQAGDVSTSNVAKWNGASWSALGSGVDSTVSDLCVTPAGNLYVGGSLSYAGGASASYAAAWNGASWSALGTGLNGEVNAVTCASDNTVIMGGYFDQAGGLASHNIARWNGTSWSGLGRQGGANGISFSVNRLAQDSQGNIWAKGGTSLALGRNVAISGDLGGLTERAYSLIPGEPGTAHLVYTDSQLDLHLRTLSATSSSWSASSPVHVGSVASVTGTYQTATQKLHVWFSEGVRVNYTTSSSPFSSWSSPTSISFGGSPEGLSSFAEATNSHSVLTTWTDTGFDPYVVRATVSVFTPPTATPTFTPTTEATSTPTPVATATSTVVPPTPTVAPPPPPDIGRAIPGEQENPLPVLVSERSLPIGGTGTIGHTVEVYVDAILVGSTPVLPTSSLGVNSVTGTWTFNIPRLAPGRRSITTKYVDAQGNRGASSPATTVVVLASAPLDFSGIGDTTITAWRRADEAIVFKSRRASGATWSTKRITGTYPVPADYDSDGVTDLAAVERREGSLRWNIRLSSSGQSISKALGKTGDTILAGCRFVSNKGRSLAVFSSSARTLQFDTYDNASPHTVRLTDLGSANILGCGDSDSDGVDELLFTTRTETNKVAVIGYAPTGKRTVNTGYDRFLRGLVVGRPNSPVPLVAILSAPHKKGRQVRITTLAGSFEFPIFHVARDATVAAGTFTVEGAEQVPGLFWSNNRTGMVYRRLLRAGAQTAALFELPRGYSLIRPHYIGRTSRATRR